MTTQIKDELQLEMTPRRAAREMYCRFLLSKVGMDDNDIDEFMATKQPRLWDHSPLEYIYTGRYEQAVDAVEDFVDGLSPEDL